MQKENILGTAPVGKLLRKFAVPSIVSMLVISLYNIVDQFFIGQTVGALGNAATNMAFPITTLCLAVTLAFGIGGASGFNLNMGAGDRNKAMKFVGNSVTMLFAVGVVIAIIVQLILNPVLVFFQTPEKVLPYAVEYLRVILLGVPFVMLAGGGAHL
ncbi:MAG: MATE family efflux transporter, partial [Eubacterium sp.]|nr:MATE family efflux transporter [Eubacterium sp.]